MLKVTIMSVRATSSWKVGAGNLASLVEVVVTKEDWEGEAEDAEKCVRLEGDQERGEVVLEAVPGKVSLQKKNYWCQLAMS